ncbi:hypothetical protein [Burkholderia plantarii]|uniref:hypothetical protein n=1 Tax=Burkholderia plantarii TaxID=41899 RepID=UPI000ABBEDE1|nr:hypothetical protein [Burkholderia plantarii]
MADRHTQREKKFTRRAGAGCIGMNHAYRANEKGFIFQGIFITALSRPLPKLWAIASRTIRLSHTQPAMREDRPTPAKPS